MTIKASTKAARAFTLWTALKVGHCPSFGQRRERQAADDILSLMTPILKGVLTIRASMHAVMAQRYSAATAISKSTA